MVGTNNHNPREMARELYKDLLQKNAMLISDAINVFIRSHANCVKYDEEDKSVEVFVVDPSKEEMDVADAIYALSNPSFDWLSASQDVKDYLKKCFADDMQEKLRSFGMALFDFETMYEIVNVADLENDSNYDENEEYIGPRHSGLRLSYMVWSMG